MWFEWFQLLADRAYKCSTCVSRACDVASWGLPFASNYTWPMFGHRTDTFWHWQYRFLSSLFLSLSFPPSLFLPSGTYTWCDQARFTISFRNEFIESAASCSTDIPWMEIYIGYRWDDGRRLFHPANQRDRARGDRLRAITVINLTWKFHTAGWK